MKKLSVIISAIVLFAFGTASFAEMKIAVVDLNKVMLESPQWEAAKTKLKNKFDAREKEILAAQKTFQNDVENFNKNSLTMKEAAKKTAQQKIIDQQKKLQDMQMKFQNDFNAAQTDALQNVMKKIDGIIKTIAADEKLDLILAKGAVPYNKPELEIADKVIKQMKK